jgi:hypothetical protein
MSEVEEGGLKQGEGVVVSLKNVGEGELKSPSPRIGRHVLLFPMQASGGRVKVNGRELTRSCVKGGWTSFYLYNQHAKD